MDDPAALLLISHGSRQPHAAAFAAELAASLRRADPDRIVAVSFLELNRPSPADALRRLGRSGVKAVLVMPLLFSAGYHYRIDVPAAVDAALESQPQLRIRTAAPLLTNSDDEFIAALDARLSEALGDTSSEPVKRPDGLVLLTAGSSDHSARARVAELADAWGRANHRPAGVAFCDLVADQVGVAISSLRDRGARRIACGALFLASGRLLDAGRRAATRAGAQAVSGPLGVTPPLLDLIRQRCQQPVAPG